MVTVSFLPRLYACMKYKNEKVERVSIKTEINIERVKTMDILIDADVLRSLSLSLSLSLSHTHTHFVCVCISYLPTPPLGQDMTQGQF